MTMGRFLIPALLVLSLWGTALAAASDPHAAMAAPGKCSNCHAQEVGFGKQPPRPMKFKKDIVSICLECHTNKDVASLHPVDIRPGMTVPSNLPLDDEGTITCATCHNPHMPSQGKSPHVAEALTKRFINILSAKDTYPTFYLRMPNDKGQICEACHPRGKMSPSAAFHSMTKSRLESYAGSAKCGECHADEYREWEKTTHARMTRDPKVTPDAILADFAANPPFQREDIVYVLGSRWTQRYVVDKKGRKYVKAPIWSIQSKTWDRSYWVDKQWDQFCEGCHTTGFEMFSEPKFAELGIGCEACHGPGLEHAKSGGTTTIVNPAKLPLERREMICQSCHTSGHDLSGQFRFPLGYIPGQDLTRYYKGLTPKPGQDNATFMGDGSYEDRNRQWQFWISNYLNAKGITCDICKNFRERQTEKETARMSVSDHCLTCHEKTWKQTETHSRHLKGGVDCTRCHTPMLNPAGDRYSIHDHKFMFGKPLAARAESPAQTCKNCHPKRKDG